MKVNIQAVNFNVDRKLVDFINQRLAKVEKFYDRIISFDVYLKLENKNEKANKTVDLKVLIPGDEVIVKKTCKSFEESADLCADAVERLLKRHKEKAKSF